MPAPDENLKTTEGWNKFVARHQGQAGVSLAAGQKKVGDKYYDANNRLIPNDEVKWKYELNDGSTIVIDNVGTTSEVNEVKPSVQTGTAAAPVPTGWQSVEWVLDENTGKEVRWGIDPADGTYKVVPGSPARTPAAKPAPDLSYRDQRTIKMPDGTSVLYGTNPTTNKFEPVPGAPTMPAEVTKPTTASIQRGEDGTLYSWDGTTLKPILPGKDKDAKEGDKRANVAGGMQIGEVYRGGNWVTDPTVEPVPWSPQAKADVVKLAGQPKDGDTRPNIVGGFKVTQTYKGGEWTTTAVGERATPRDIQTLTPSTEAPYIVQTDETGKPVSVPNPNYQGPKAPTTRGEIAQRVATLQTQMAQMRDKIYADKSIPADQQSARFSQWYDQNVTPQIGALEQQQQAVISDEGQKAIEAQQKSLTTASAAMQGIAPYRVGPGYAQSFEQGLNRLANTQFPGMKAQTPLDFTGSVGWKGPSLDQSVQEVLAARQPVQPGMDLQSMLNRNQWVPGGGGPPPVPGAVPGGAPPPTPEQLAARAAAGQQTAAASANPANSPLGAVGPNPLLVALQARNRQLASQQTAAATAQAGGGGFGGPIGPGTMPTSAPMPIASGGGPLPYNRGAFSGVMPLLPGFDYSQFQNQWQPSY